MVNVLFCTSRTIEAMVCFAQQMHNENTLKKKIFFFSFNVLSIAVPKNSCFGENYVSFLLQDSLV